jgi:hypothetical protein
MSKKRGSAVEGQKRQMGKNHYFGIFGQENLIFPEIIGFVCFRARLKSKKKIERTFWMDKNLKISTKEHFSQKRPILQSELVLRFENILFEFKSRSEVHASYNL